MKPTSIPIAFENPNITIHENCYIKTITIAGQSVKLVSRDGLKWVSAPINISVPNTSPISPVLESVASARTHRKESLISRGGRKKKIVKRVEGQSLRRIYEIKEQKIRLRDAAAPQCELQYLYQPLKNPAATNPAPSCKLRPLKALGIMSGSNIGD
jgi:hypothetical protein